MISTVVMRQDQSSSEDGNAIVPLTDRRSDHDTAIISRFLFPRAMCSSTCFENSRLFMCDVISTLVGSPSNLSLMSQHLAQLHLQRHRSSHYPTMRMSLLAAATLPVTSTNTQSSSQHSSPSWKICPWNWNNKNERTSGINLAVRQRKRSRDVYLEIKSLVPCQCWPHCRLDSP